MRSETVTSAKRVLWVGAICVAAYWGSHVAAVRASDRYAELRTQFGPSYLVNGYVPDLDSSTTRLGQNVPPARQGMCRIVFMLSDTCQGCKVELPMWKRLITGTVGRPVRYEFIGVQGRALVDELVVSTELSSDRYGVRRVTDPASFVAQTGLVASPMTVLLDRQGVARAVSRNLDNATYVEFMRAVEECVSST